MTTRIKAWLFYNGDMGRVITTNQLKLPRTHDGGRVGTEGVFLPTAELDTLVAAAEARGAAEGITYAVGVMDNHSPATKQCCEDTLQHIAGIITSYSDAPTTIQAHTQRQRDEVYNEGVEAAMGKLCPYCKTKGWGFTTVALHPDGKYKHSAICSGPNSGKPVECKASAILALRKETP